MSSPTSFASSGGPSSTLMRAPSPESVPPQEAGAPPEAPRNGLLCNPREEDTSRSLPSAPLPRLVVSPLWRGELLRPFGRLRQPKEFLFLKNVARRRKTAADMHQGALSGPVGATHGAPLGSSSGGTAETDSSGDSGNTQGSSGGHLPLGRQRGAFTAAAAAAGAAAVAATGHTTLAEAAAAVGRRLLPRGVESAPQEASPTMPTQRVNQLDALRVDNEIVLLLQDLLLQCTRAAMPRLQQWQQELKLLLNIFLWSVSTARDRPTPGDLLQNVKYYGGEQLQQQELQRQQQRLQEMQQDPTAAPAAVQQQQRVLLHMMMKQQHSLLQQQPLPWGHKLGLLLLHVLLPYLYQLVRQLLHRKRQQQQAAIEQRIRRFNVAQALRRQRMQQQQLQQKKQQQKQQATEQQQWEMQQQLQLSRLLDAAAGAAVTRLTPAEQSLECLYRCCMVVDLLLSFLRFCFFFYFLYKGRHRSLGDWLLGVEMRHIHPSLRRSLSFELLQQQLYWLSVSHVLLLVVPHIDLLLLRRTLGQHVLSPARAAAVASLQQLKQLLRKQQQQLLEQQQGPEMPNAQAATDAADLPPLGIGQWCLLLLRSTKQQLTAALQNVGLLPHPLVTQEQQRQEQQVQQEEKQQKEAVEQTLTSPEPSNEVLKPTLSPVSPFGPIAEATTAAELPPSAAPSPVLPSTPVSVIPEKPPQRQQKQQCVFCSKEPLLPFCSNKCPHVFCYWCVASHPDYRPGSWGYLEGDEEHQLHCPKCGMVIRRILWRL
ncbi:Pex2 / Pex12 amino terminal domain-containing protein, putative [Eimeria tenella]|uniref:RING-type E3 ubiquitin transferase (cysteine targeting) n=1 Tax=Eimeria tenella TaxID=5802 RepID=U6KIL6_EIMTE|nr:Pex2 / Pex12 amino terminal domain-containing protein, putative [Eimeria tenella]CDJ37784.1 Pex2 / Pex12 amino terminal domain-containing protein, putative [Eimeria tenella]|eukprot:XP_013228622.1 Pex2 / Pex12 amino terminal domain-containing protein, putative [Eimeria tenella]